jgi:hypothetical protein
MRHHIRNAPNHLPLKKVSNKGRILFALSFVCLLVCLMVFIQIAFDIESPMKRFETRSAGTVVDVRFHHGLGKRTEVRTTTDILLVVEAARLAIGQEFVLQRSENSERLCVKDLQRCWRVVND